MEDSALALRANSATTLNHKLSAVTGAIIDGCLGRARLPNLDRGKTEAVVSLCGKGCRGERAKLLRDDPAAASAHSSLWPNAAIQLAPAYKHLGGLIHHTGALLREVRHRSALACATFNKRRKKIVGSLVVCWP